MIARLAIVLIIFGVAVVLCLRTPRIPAAWMAWIWKFLIHPLVGGNRPEPAWVSYYLGKLPPNARPSDAAGLEDWIRMLAVLLLAFPLVLLLALFVLAP